MPLTSEETSEEQSGSKQRIDTSGEKVTIG